MTTGLALQLSASFLSLTGMWIMATRPFLGALIGQAANSFWLALNLHYELYGLIPFSLAMIIAHARVIWTWWPEEFR